MSLPDLAAVLWRQRDLLERLVYRLECEQLLLAAGRTRFLALATGEVEELVAALRVRRACSAPALPTAAAREAGLAPGAGLAELAAAVQPPWTGVLVEHRDALLALTRELGALAESNRTLMAAGLRAVEAALAGAGEPRRDGVRRVRRAGPQRPAVGRRADRRRPGAVRPA